MTRFPDPRPRVLSELDGPPLSAVRGPDSPDSLSGVLDVAAAGGATVGTIDSDGTSREESWRSLRERARRVAEDIRRRGLEPGDVAVVAATEPSQLLALFWGGVLAGVEPLLVPAELLAAPGGPGQWWAALAEQAPVRGVLHARGTRFAIVDDAPGRGIAVAAVELGAAGEHAATAPARADDGPASRVHFMTSGSTGAPKVVPQRHRGIVDMALGATSVNGLDSTTVGFNWMPLSHVGGMLMAHVRDAVIGAKHLSAATERVLADPGEWFRVVTEHRVTAVWSPNFAYRLLAGVAEGIAPGGDVDVSSIRFCLNGGEAVSAKDCARFEAALGRLGLPRGTIAPAWGMAETCSGVLYAPRYDPAADTSATVSVGSPLPGVRVRVVADDSDDAADDQGTGHLEVQGSPVLEGYLVGGDLRGTADGWFRTGDLARIDADGVRVVGRDGTRVVANGVTWNSADLEAEVERVDGVLPGTAVLASYRARGTERDEIAVFCAVGDGSPERVRGQVARRVEAIIGGRVAHVVDIPPSAIERTSIGKVRKARLVRRFLNPDPPPVRELVWRPRPAPRPGTRQDGTPVLLRGPGLTHSAVDGHAPRDLHGALEHWRGAVDPAGLRGRDVVVVVDAYEADAAELPRSHPVAAFLRAVAHGAGARSVRTAWVHPRVDEDAVAAVLDEELAQDSAADLYLDPHGAAWLRTSVPVSGGSTAVRGDHVGDHVVVLGGTGRLGEVLGAELTARGARVTLVGRGPSTGAGRLAADLGSPAAARDLVARLDWNAAERTLVVHLAGAPLPGPGDEVARLLAPKTAGVRAAAGLARALGADLAVVSSVNAHIAGTGHEAYSAACAAAEAVATQVGAARVVSVTAVGEARQTDEATAAVAAALGLDEVSVVDLATCLLSAPPGHVLLGVGEHTPFLPRREWAGRPAPAEAAPDQAAPAETGWPPTVADLAAALRSVVAVDAVHPAANWFDMGLTSVDLPNLARVVAERTGQRVGVLELMRFPNLAELAGHIDHTRDRSGA
ncbi:AMP-binding protein [Actinokineospora pegani]|uniref:AMP-binding protein n=1 Tax=Actinokineospora pegani TaxID=2654637 RepID=UPI0012EAC12E|nr:AMP-binding protein [Actinokineospora pegani]